MVENQSHNNTCLSANQMGNSGTNHTHAHRKKQQLKLLFNDKVLELSLSPVQCYGETTYCWCVDQDGREVPGTRSHDVVKPACEYVFIT